MPFFTMKLVRGETLADMLSARSSPAADLPKFLSIFESICQTMAYAHARGVIHRDLKPANVMVGNFGEVQVMDWGLAKVLSRDDTRGDGTAISDDTNRTLNAIRTARSGSDADASRSGSVIGTPAYMAPEQARGEIDLLDERTDVFGLGAILCVILTGQPAFAGRSVIETLEKAARGDLDNTFARLEASGAERELTDLAEHCLAPRRDDRPRSAQQVVQRVTAYLTGVQERLRRAEMAQIEEKARRRLTVAIAASVVGLVVLAGSGWAFLEDSRARRRAATERIVNQALDEATLAWGQARSAPIGDLSAWSAAVNAAKKAEGLLAAGEAGSELTDRVLTLVAALQKGRATAQSQAQEVRRDRALLERLEQIRLERSIHHDNARTDADYLAAFLEFGINFEKLDAKDAGNRLATRSAPIELAAFVDDWVYVNYAIRANKEKGLWRRLNEAARAADPDPWRGALRSQIQGTDKAALLRLADDQQELARQPASSLLLLARWLQAVDDRSRAEAVLLRAWRLQPDDFWVNDQLGWLYLWGSQLWSQNTKPAEAARYYSAAVAIKPRSAVAHMNLGVALCPIQLDRGVDELRESIRLNPGSAAAHINLAVGLNQQFKLAEMTDEFRAATRLEPGSVTAYHGLGFGLFRLEKRTEAIAAFRKAVRLDPRNWVAHHALAMALAYPPNCPQSVYDEAVAEARKAVELAPRAESFAALALAEYRVGHLAESVAASERSIALNSDPEADLWFVLALARWRKGEKDKAGAAFHKGVDWCAKHPRRTFSEHRQVWSEAAELLGRPGPPQSTTARQSTSGSAQPR
jgi:tetratricopeptide (TPR) repeat protein